MRKKQIVLFIVEGLTDKESLELILQDVIGNDNEVLFEVVNGDVTSAKSSEPENIKKKITEIIKSNGKRKYKSIDYKEIIHLVDMDGAYIDDSLLHEDVEHENFHYKEDGIYAKNRDNIVERNSRKRSILNKLLETSKVWKIIPYRVFYFSCNLEHVLHDEREVEKNEKSKYASSFEDRYIDNIDEFIDFICKSHFSVSKDYKDSWEFIKKDNNSIKRYTNFDIFIKEEIGKPKSKPL